MDHSNVIDQARAVLRESQRLINQFRQQGWVPLGGDGGKRSVFSYREAVHLARKASEASPLIIAGIPVITILAKIEKQILTDTAEASTVAQEALTHI